MSHLNILNTIPAEPMAFNFLPGRVLARKYEVVNRLRAGTLGEFYRLNETSTGIERTGKFFYPHLDPSGRLSVNYAKKLYRLRRCDELMQYHTQERIKVGGRSIVFLVSDPLAGEPLREFLARQPKGRLPVFEALHLLHAMATGVARMHKTLEFHGALVMDNVLVRRQGLGFKVKLIDPTPTNGATLAAQRRDTYDLLRMFHETIGGAPVYARTAQPVKDLCMGLRAPEVYAAYRDADALRVRLESLSWHRSEASLS